MANMYHTQRYPLVSNKLFLADGHRYNVAEVKFTTQRFMFECQLHDVQAMHVATTFVPAILCSGLYDWVLRICIHAGSCQGWLDTWHSKVWTIRSSSYVSILCRATLGPHVCFFGSHHHPRLTMAWKAYIPPVPNSLYVPRTLNMCFTNLIICTCIHWFFGLRTDKIASRIWLASCYFLRGEKSIFRITCLNLANVPDWHLQLEIANQVYMQNSCRNIKIFHPGGSGYFSLETPYLAWLLYNNGHTFFSCLGGVYYWASPSASSLPYPLVYSPPPPTGYAQDNTNWLSRLCCIPLLVTMQSIDKTLLFPKW